MPEDTRRYGFGGGLFCSTQITQHRQAGNARDQVIGVFNAPANQRSTLPMDIVIPKKMKSPEFPLNSGLHISHVSKITLPKLESIEPLLTA
jgi:hypothetical protein